MVIGNFCRTSNQHPIKWVLEPTFFPKQCLHCRGSGGFSSDWWSVRRVCCGFAVALSCCKFPIKLNVEAPNATRNGRFFLKHCKTQWFWSTLPPRRLLKEKGVIFWWKKTAGGSLGIETWLLKEKGSFFDEKKPPEAAWGSKPGSGGPKILIFQKVWEWLPLVWKMSGDLGGVFWSYLGPPNSHIIKNPKISFKNNK